MLNSGVIVEYMAWSDFSPMTHDSINRVPQTGGVYQLNSDSGILYIGQTDNLRRRLGEHLNSDDSCIQRTRQFSYQESDDPGGLESKILQKISDDNNGDLPPCNKQAS